MNISPTVLVPAWHHYHPNPSVRANQALASLDRFFLNRRGRLRGRSRRNSVEFIRSALEISVQLLTERKRVTGELFSISNIANVAANLIESTLYKGYEINRDGPRIEMESYAADPAMLRLLNKFLLLDPPLKPEPDDPDFPSKEDAMMIARAVHALGQINRKPKH